MCNYKHQKKGKRENDGTVITLTLIATTVTVAAEIEAVTAILHEGVKMVLVIKGVLRTVATTPLLTAQLPVLVLLVPRIQTSQPQLPGARTRLATPPTNLSS